MRRCIGWTYRRADRLIVHHAAAIDDLASLGAPRERVTVIPHGLFDLPDAAPAAPRAGVHRGLNLLLFGQIRANKNILAAIAAVQALRAQGRDISLRICGKASAREADYLAACRAAADDGGCVIAPDSGASGRWHRLYHGPVDVRWFGARGDGLADDCDALQRAVTHHSDVYMPAGVYRLTRPLDLSELWGRRIAGAGQTADARNPAGFENGKLSRATTLLLDADNAPVLRLAGSGHAVERLCLMAKTRQPRAADKS